MSASGVSVDPEKVEAVMSWERPKHRYLRCKAHRGAKAFWGLEAQGALEARAFLLEAHPT